MTVPVDSAVPVVTRGTPEMIACAIDLRQRGIDARDARDGTRPQIAARFPVSESWTRKILGQRRDTGSIEPRSHGGGRAPAFDAAAGRRLREAVRADDDPTLEGLAGAAGVACSEAAVCPALARLGITREKKSRRAGERDRTEMIAERAARRKEFAGLDPAKLVSLDESGASTGMLSARDRIQKRASDLDRRSSLDRHCASWGRQVAGVRPPDRARIRKRISATPGVAPTRHHALSP